MSRWLPSLNVPVAVNDCVPPTATVALEGLTTIESNVGAAAARMVCALWAPNVAVIRVLPAPAVVARPRVPAALLMTATDDCDDPHTTVVVRSCVDPSV